MSPGIQARPIILTGVGGTLVDVLFTASPGEAHHTVTPERARSVHTRTSMLTRRVPACHSHIHTAHVYMDRTTETLSTKSLLVATFLIIAALNYRDHPTS